MGHAQHQQPSAPSCAPLRPLTGADTPRRTRSVRLSHFVWHANYKNGRHLLQFCLDPTPWRAQCVALSF